MGYTWWWSNLLRNQRIAASWPHSAMSLQPWCNWGTVFVGIVCLNMANLAYLIHSSIMRPSLTDVSVHPTNSCSRHTSSTSSCSTSLWLRSHYERKPKKDLQYLIICVTNFSWLFGLLNDHNIKYFILCNNKSQGCIAELKLFHHLQVQTWNHTINTISWIYPNL